MTLKLDFTKALERGHLQVAECLDRLSLDSGRMMVFTHGIASDGQTVGWYINQRFLENSRETKGKGAGGLGRRRKRPQSVTGSVLVQKSLQMMTGWLLTSWFAKISARHKFQDAWPWKTLYGSVTKLMTSTSKVICGGICVARSLVENDMGAARSAGHAQK